MATFEAPNYVIGNSSSITASLSSVLTTLDQALQALQPAPSSTIVKFNNTVRCDAGTSRLIEMNNTDITSIDGGVGTMTYIPSFVLPAVSNQSIQIPPFNQNPHQIIFQSALVPLIDTLVSTTYAISGEQINCFGHNGGDMYIGCESGNIYWFNITNPSWDLIMTMDGSIRCLYYHSQSGRMYIGFKGQNMISPSSIGGLNYICYSTSFPYLYNSITVDVWNNYATNGFDGAVNAVSGDGTYLYFGGEYGKINGGAFDPKYISMYEWNSTGNIYSFDNGSGYGFDASVFGLSLISDRLCATGTFNTVICNMGYISGFYCVNITLIAGFIVNSIEFLFGNPYTLTNPISILDSVKGDGSIFWISTNDINLNGSGTNYMCQAPYYSFSSTSLIGNNEFSSSQTSYNLEGSIGSVGISNQEYYIFGDLKATFTFQPYIYWNYQYGRQEFIDLSSGQIYAFTGSTQNTFSLMGGRIISYAGNDYSTGWSITPTGNGLGYSSTLLWNGSYYFPTSISGGSPF